MRRTGKQRLVAARYNLLHKTELQVGPIVLSNANLNQVAATIADVLGLEREGVVVTDVRDSLVTIDILRDSIDVTQIVGRQGEVIRGLAQLPGVEVNRETSISSHGMLGWIAQDRRRAKAALRRTEQMIEEVQRNLQRRAIVFSTGLEVSSGKIQDTNAPMLVRRFQNEGYVVAAGPILPDDQALIAGAIREAICEGGYSLVITTGGVGAEDKDCTIEALLELDPAAATPYVCRYEIGTGRHRKDGVRIGIGNVLDALIVSLPGPNDEVRASIEVLLSGLEERRPKEHIAEEIARSLREKLRREMKH